MNTFAEDLQFITENYPIENNGKLVFPMKQFDTSTPIDVLVLSTRASNGLKIAGVKTFGDICKYDSLLRLKNLGIKSAKEINMAFMSYFYDQLDEDERKKFWQDTVRLTEEKARETEVA